MILALNIAFWVWCAALTLFAVLTGVSARGLSAEAGGAGAFMLFTFTVVLLVISLSLRAIGWWLL